MTGKNAQHLLYAGVAIATLVSGCTTISTEEATPDAMALTDESPAAVNAPNVDTALQLLGDGKAGEARVILEKASEGKAANTAAARLLAQIDGDPRAILGDEYQPYTVQTGDTMSELAERFTGDRLLFYALTRLNGLASPKQLAAGAEIEVPVRKIAEAEPEDVATPDMKNETVASYGDAPALRDAVEPDGPTDAERTEASELRRAALKSLNGGDVEKAVKNLRLASRLNPEDGAIAADLNRAERLLTTVMRRVE